MACDLNSITRQVLAKWRASHGGAIPKTSADKDAMRDMIEDMQVAETKDEENFVEAKQLARHAYSPFEIPSEVKAILSDPKVHDDSTCHEPFWYLILKKVVARITEAWQAASPSHLQLTHLFLAAGSS